MFKSKVIQKLTEGKILDKYDPNTICGCLNRIQKMSVEKTLSEKYNLDPESDITGWIFWKLQEASFWPADEFDYTRLKGDYETCSPGIQYGVDLTNGWFAGGDGLIVMNCAFRFAMESKTVPETGAMLTQAKQEFVHADSYRRVIESTSTDPKRRNEVLKMADNIPCVRDKELLMEEYMQTDISKGYRIVAFAGFEGIQFWGSFLFIFWLRSMGIFTTLAELNEKIAMDESMHRDYACARFRELPHNEKPTYEEVVDVLTEILDLEIVFAIELTLKLEREGYDLTPDVAAKFIRHMGNNLLIGLGFEPYWKDTAFPEYMKCISTSQKSNFYEVNVGAYTQFSMNKIFERDENVVNDDIDDIDNVDF